jgi:hypothetical protein
LRDVEIKSTLYERDNELLERAFATHQQLIDQAIKFYRSTGYDTFSNLHADLVAENEKEILLFEAKSAGEGKFRTQARNAIGQLYQYEYFDISDHQRSNETTKPVSKRLLIPDDPGDGQYLGFLEAIDISTFAPSGGQIIKLRD